jgi:hypothetical protein
LGSSRHVAPGSDAEMLLPAVLTLHLGPAPQESHKSLQQAHAALQAQAATKALENIELQRELQAQWAAGEPAVLQLKQLLLDPAVNREFTRLSSELEEARSQLRQAQEELRAVTFTAVGAWGHGLSGALPCGSICWLCQCGMDRAYYLCQECRACQGLARDVDVDCTAL